MAKTGLEWDDRVESFKRHFSYKDAPTHPIISKTVVSKQNGGKSLEIVELTVSVYSHTDLGGFFCLKSFMKQNLINPSENVLCFVSLLNQDKSDDIRIGVKSTALRFGNQTKLWLAGPTAFMFGNLALSGYMCDQIWPYYTALAFTMLHVANQVRKILLYMIIHTFHWKHFVRV